MAELSRRIDPLLTLSNSCFGHYIPQLADLILDYNKRFSGRPIKLKAIALGNPLLDPDISVINAESLCSHGVISDETLLLSKTVCNASRHLKESIHQNLSKECIHVLNKLEEAMGSYTDPGDLILPICLSPTLLGQTFYQGTHNRLHWKLAMSSAVATDPCRGDEIRQYLNTPKVQEALHANTTHLSSVWEFCRGHLSYQRESIGINIIPLLSKLLKSSILVLLFNGDQDSKIPLTQTRIIANMLAKELKLVPVGSYALWYDKKQACFAKSCLLFKVFSSIHSRFMV